MSYSVNDRYIYWNDIAIGKISEATSSIEPASNSIEQSNIDKMREEFHREIDDVKVLILELSKQTDGRLARVTHNFRVLDKRTKDSEESTKNLTDLCVTLQESKLDRPSHSNELANAEKYVDDYQQVRRKFAAEKFARKQRIQKILNSWNRSIEKKQEDVNEEKEQKSHTSMTFLIWFAIISLVSTVVWALI